MPLLNAEATKCTADMPCPVWEPCARCAAEVGLESDDWEVVEFYRMVADQYTNQTPGVDHPVLTPNLDLWWRIQQEWFADTPNPRRLLTDAQALHYAMRSDPKRRSKMLWQEYGLRYSELDRLNLDSGAWKDDGDQR